MSKGGGLGGAEGKGDGIKDGDVNSAFEALEDGCGIVWKSLARMQNWSITSSYLTYLKYVPC